MLQKCDFVGSVTVDAVIGVVAVITVVTLVPVSQLLLFSLLSRLLLL